MDPGWLSNAYLLADEEGGAAVFVDSGAPMEPLLEAAERWHVRPRHVLRTHADLDHVAHEAELGVEVVTGGASAVYGSDAIAGVVNFILKDDFEGVALDTNYSETEDYGGDNRHVAHEAELGVEVVTGPLEVGALRIEALPTPGHSEDHLAFVVNGELCFSGDIVFKDAVGGGRDVPAIQRSVMDVLMKLPPETRVLPGHTDETTIGREWEQNPFVRYWRGLDPSVDEPCEVGGQEARIVVDSPDYDGKGKLLVRFADGREAIVGGSRIVRI